MPLQHSHENEEQPAPLSSFSTVRTVTQQEAALEAAPRYDTATVKQIIALAEQMQTHHRQTMTQSEVEALGREVGVEPQFIRRALAQMAQMPQTTQGEANSANTVPHRTAAKTTGAADIANTIAVAEPSGWQPLTELTRRQRRLMRVPMALFFLLLPFTLGGINLGEDINALVMIVMYAIVPAVMAFYLGSRDKNYRFGTFVGATTGLLASVSTILNDAAAHHHSIPMGAIVTLFFTWIGVGLVLGLLGAVLRREHDRVRA